MCGYRLFHVPGGGGGRGGREGNEIINPEELRIFPRGFYFQSFLPREVSKLDKWRGENFVKLSYST
jgi:hypothetical protein